MTQYLAYVIIFQIKNMRISSHKFENVSQNLPRTEIVPRIRSDLFLLEREDQIKIWNCHFYLKQKQI